MNIENNNLMDNIYKYLITYKIIKIVKLLNTYLVFV
jgi:hypothetical protein